MWTSTPTTDSADKSNSLSLLEMPTLMPSDYFPFLLSGFLEMLDSLLVEEHIIEL